MGENNKELSTLKALTLGLGLGALSASCSAGGILGVSSLLMPYTTEVLLTDITNEIEDIIGINLDEFTPWEERVVCVYGPAPGPTIGDSFGDEGVTGFN